MDTIEGSMPNCPRDGSALTPAAQGTSLGADALICPKCQGASCSPLGARWFLSELGLTQSWPELVKAGEAQLKGGGSKLKCVRCGQGCELLVLKGVELDVCNECGAAWFDGGEVQRLWGPKRPGQVVGVFEMFWDCAYCDTRALLGKTNRYCPSCGAPQDPKKRYFPPAGKEVRANTAYEGVDLSCPACQTPNGAKAKCCRQCGSPLTEAGRVALVQRQGGQQPASRPAAPKPSSKWPWLLGAAGALVLGLIIVAATWKKEVKVTVGAHAWERVIDIEQKRARSDSSWCDSTPSDAYAVSHKREQRSTRQVADGQECHTENHDRGDGTFEKREVCKTKYRSEPVYDDRCYYTVDRWEQAREVRASGALKDAPQWPEVSLARACSSLGCEREGPHHETYTVKLTSSEQRPYSCDFPESRWQQLVEGKSYPMKVRVMTGGADCDTLRP
jgi:hypothetical protein